MKLTIVGSGDAFGTGGRGHSCFHVATDQGGFLIDCGASASCSMAKCGIGMDQVDAIFLTHLHGDHFGGLPIAVLDAAYISNRTKPLELYGPPTLKERYIALAEAMYPGMTQSPRTFEINFHELSEVATTKWRDITVAPFAVEHPSGAPSFALRFEQGERTIAYSGDSQWCDGVVDAGQGADLYLLECYSYDQDIPHHMNWLTIVKHLDKINATRVVLTHMSAQMLAKAAGLNHPNVSIAYDGLTFDL